MDKMDGGIAVLCAAPTRKKNSDVNYSYRQDSSLYYLTGFDEPESVLVLTPNDKECQTRLFLREKNPAKEQWDGRRLGVEAAPEKLGIDKAYSYGEFSRTLVGLLENKKRLYIDMFEEPEQVHNILSLAHKAGMKKRTSFGPTEFVHLLDVLGPMRLVKDSLDLKHLKEAARVNDIAHRRAMAMTRPGMNEADIHADILAVFKKNQMREAYGSIVAGGNNANILHYIDNNQPLRDGDLFLIDAGPEYHCSASDVTRTFPVNGTYSGAAKEVYEAVLEVQKNCIDQVRSGNTPMGIHDLSEKLLAQVLIDLKIVEGSLDKVLEEKKHRVYYPHGLGHWLGLDVHDVGPYRQDNGEPLQLAAGMCMTVEPGLYIPSEDLSVPERFRGIGIRIEDDILVTDTGNENLTKSIPKEVAEVEQACKANLADIC
jgi:Xaa-Pro aminopeptidase